METIKAIIKQLLCCSENIEIIMSIITMLAAFIGSVYTFFKIKSAASVNRYLKRLLSKDTMKRLKYYIDTNGQQTDPCEEEEIGKLNEYCIKERLIPFFIKKVFKNNIPNQYFIILGDSGMGKTTFMIQLFKKYRKKHHKDYNIEFIPLYARYLEIVDSIGDKQNTILLLDGLDENPDAMKDYKGFLKELSEHTEAFHKVIITCRTQFFPNEKEEPHETGRISLNLDNKKNLFYKIYLSPFDDNDIRRFLRKRYPFLINRGKKKKAQAIIEKSPLLMVRPMLLSYIDELISGNREYNHIYQIYEQLIDNWIHREKIPHDELYNFTRQTTLHMYKNNTIYINSEDISKLCDKYNINIEDIDARSKSLLNRNGNGIYKFAHKSIYEYLLANEALHNADFRKKCDFSGFDMAKKFYDEMVRVYLENLQSLKKIYADLSNMNLENLSFKGVTFYGVSFQDMIIDHCEFIDCMIINVNLRDCQFYNCNLSGTDMKECKATNLNLINCELISTNCSNMEWRRCAVMNSNLKKSQFIGTSLSNCTFTHSNVSYADFSTAFIESCSFETMTLAPIKYYGLRADMETYNRIVKENIRLSIIDEQDDLEYQFLHELSGKD